MQDVEKLLGLEALRGIAAVSVAVFHTVVLLGLIPLADLPWWFKQLFIAVPLFFAISAFSLCVGYFGKLNSAVGLGRFYARRLLRIAPLFYLLIAMTVLAVSFLHGAWKLPSVGDLALNLSFTFNFVPGKHVSLVWAGWSMGPEMIFYAAFPLLVALLTTARIAMVVLTASFAVAITAGIMFTKLPEQYEWMSVLSQACFFVCGVLMFHLFRIVEELAVLTRKVLAGLLFLTTLIVLVVLAAVDQELFVFGGWNSQPHLVGVALMPIVLALALMPVRLVVNRLTIFIGKISYGVYLIHPLVIVVVGKPMVVALQGQTHWTICAVVIAGVQLTTIAIASATYYGFERRLMRWLPVERREKQTRSAAL